ncbi:PQQ-dependent sugar dehydrogenase [Virgisporangium ochraceum]|uniref:Oxidoreductase n=1 Tax=Virgisporangium ochraceum TaxID=65505 RepID=A0A8J3ZVZ0_9ACTN|nr:PQQ-dependent sugar dehydrogenase [Virgisporangium ochraceum]GIJ68436.1 oxidoreductase [Virgisporangium ochraceum]
MGLRPSVVAVVAVLGGALLGACGDEESPTATPAPATSAPAPSASAGSASARPAATPNLGAPQQMATGVDVPWGLAFLPGGDALVSERNSGRILQISGGTTREVYRVPGVAAAGEGGLLGIAVSPGFAQDRYVYAYFTASGDNRIVRFRLGESAAPQVVFSGIVKAGTHNGGRIAFGPDGMLYVGTGDAQQRPLSQNPSSPNGKILRLTPDGKPAPGNPTEGSPVYSLGHRNVQGLAWDAQGRLYATEFGQNRFDEVNRIEPGRNYGWPEVEGSGDGGGRFAAPLLVWQTSESSPSGAAIIGGTLYVAALRGERLWVVPLTGDGRTGQPAAQLQNLGRLRTVEVAPDGSLWVTTSNTDGRGDERSGDDRVVRFAA